jgi:sporulation protein YtfJ
MSEKQDNIEYSHPIEQIMKTTMTKLKSVIDVNTVIGQPLETKDGTTIIPISKVTVGFVTGGGEYTSNYPKSKYTGEDYPFAGGAGSGFNIMPVGFLIKEGDSFKMLDVTPDATASNLFEMVANIVSAFSGTNNNDDEGEKNEK